MKQVFSSILLVFLVAVAITAQDKIESYTKVGQPMPDFAVTDFSGKKFTIAELKGKIIYVNFWTTSCPPCLIEIPRVEKEVWQKNSQSENFAMMAIAAEPTDKEVVKFIKKYAYSFPTAVDTDRAVFKLFGNVGVPRSYVVGADGSILFQAAGYSDTSFDEMEAIIERELKKLEPSK